MSVGAAGAAGAAAPAIGALGGMATGQATQLANQIMMMTTDSNQAQTIYTQIAADAVKQRAERWKIQQDLQTKLFEITQDVTVNKAKAADKAFTAMDGYIRQ